MSFDMQILIFWRCLLVVLLTVLDNAVLFVNYLDVAIIIFVHIKQPLKK